MKRLVTLSAAGALLLMVLAPTALAAGPTRHLRQVDIGKIDPSFRPFLADPSRTVTVVLQLAGDPAISGQGLTRAQRTSEARGLSWLAVTYCHIWSKRTPTFKVSLSVSLHSSCA